MDIHQQSYIQEDEIDLKELFFTIKKNIKYIGIFVALITIITFFYIVTQPNIYQSSTILIPHKTQSSANGRLSSLAAIAGVNIGGVSNSNKDPYTLLKVVLDNIEFHKKVAEKYNFIDRLTTSKNLVYPFGIEVSKDNKKDSKETFKKYNLFSIGKKLRGMISISSDNKSGLITLKSICTDRFLAQELVTIYLYELIETVKKKDMSEIKKRIEYYKKEISSTSDVSLKEHLSKSLSALIQKRVFLLASDYYFVSQLTEPRVSHIQEKIKPKRSLILIVSIITSLMLAIFIVFFIEFIKNKDVQKSSLDLHHKST
jgi:uncharacterized protein involved in exopolysaccharide biosynthesis